MASENSRGSQFVLSDKTSGNQNTSINTTTSTNNVLSSNPVRTKLIVQNLSTTAGIYISKNGTNSSTNFWIYLPPATANYVPAWEDDSHTGPISINGSGTLNANTCEIV